MMSTAEDDSSKNVKLPVSAETPLVTAPRKNEASGYVYMLLSAIFVSGSTFLVQLAEVYYFVPIATVLFIRGFMLMVFSASCALASPTALTTLGKLSNEDKLTLVARGISGCLGKLCMMIALRHVSLGDAITVFLTNPVFTLLFSHFFIGEPLTFYDVTAGFVSLLGVALITHQDPALMVPQANRVLGIACAASAAVLGALAFTLVRSLGNKIHFAVSTLSLATCVLISSALLGGVLPTSEFLRLKEGIAISFGAAVLALVSQCCSDKGLQHCRAGPGTLIRMVQVPSSFLLGTAFLNQVLSWRSLGGSCLVLAAAAAVSVRQIVR